MGIETEWVYESSIKMILFNSTTKQLDMVYDLAYFKEIEGTMDETQNSWFLDEDGDGDLDIAMMIELNDYELPNEYSDNISGVEGFLYRNNNGTLSAEYISKELYTSLTIKK